MTYQRVIPRDLFNEANLLKCYGRIYIVLERMDLPHVELEHDGGSFEVEQDESSGSITISNVHLRVGERFVPLSRPMNSREAWPLVMLNEDEEEVLLFDEHGEFTAEALEFFRSHAHQRQARDASDTPRSAP
jgi:hypothetical protein